MKFTRTPAQQHDYNLKFTKSELSEIAAVISGEYVHAGGAWGKMLELIKIEGKRLGNASGE